ncbi:MAG: hypothetical protein ACI4LO_04610 [Anaerovoracaceae bacterium]
MNMIEFVDKEIKELWKNEIYRDYKNKMLLKEDSLKNAFYHHLRNRISDEFMIKNRIRIFTEFNDGELKGTKKRADIAIVQLEETDEDGEYKKHLKKHVEKIIAIIELKHKFGMGKVVDDIYGDVDKVKDYIQKDKIDCQYYLGIIHEEEWGKRNWLDERQIKYWPQGKVTELVASYDENHMNFEVYSYNELNKSLNDYKQK